ncbi:MAG: hypothetical protein Q9161_005690 [Pseudevernia consocians]
MNVPYVCLRCSRQLFRWKCQRRSSGFVSLGQLVGCDESSRTTPQDVPLAHGDSTAIRLPRRKKRLTFAQTYQEQRRPTGVDKALETLFASNLEHEPTLEKSRYSRTPKVSSTKAAAIEKLALDRSIKLRCRELDNKLLRGTAPLQEIWRDCKKLLVEIWNRKDDAMIGGPQIPLGDTSLPVGMFRHVLIATCQTPRLVIDDQKFTPADAIRIYTKYGVMRGWWQDVLWCQLGNVLKLKYQSTDGTLGAASDGRIRVLIGEILEVWNLYTDRYSSSSISVPFIKNSYIMDDETSTSEPFSTSFPKQLQQRMKRPDKITVAAAMTLDCLRATGMRAPLRVLSQFDRFGQALGRDRSIAVWCLLHAGVSSGITEKALEGWEAQTSLNPEEILKPTKTNEFRLSKYPLDVSETKHDLDWSEKGLPARLADIDGASKRSNTAFAVNLWRQFQAHFKADRSKDKTDSTDEIYARFLRTFWALRCHDHAIEIWNHMINSGHLPGQKHWTAMLSGCTRAKDVKSLQEIWTNMLRSGTPPNTTTWTAYIRGLIECHKWEEGLNALEQLGRIWKSAPPFKISDTAGEKTTVPSNADENQSPEEPEDDTILRPTIHPINATLSALIHIDKRSLLPRVRAWAQFHQIPLSTVTFNILLRPLVRHDSPASIQAHLQQMADAKCTPDVATFSIILNGLVSNPTSPFHTLTPEAQESTITSILADMGRQGIEPNPFTYGTLLDGLLTPGSKELSHDYTPNVPAARNVLAHMAARNIYASPHIYTILITHYFTCRPLPDLPAISSLWSSIRHSGQMYKLDNIFFDRLIEGYADNDEIEESLKFLKLVSESGKSPGWGALVKVLKAMVRGEEWEWCAELVEDVERQGGLLRCGQGRGQGREKAEFWEMVDILRARGVVLPVDEGR